MLKPQINKHRQWVELSGFWDFLPDPDDQGLAESWHGGLSGAMPIAVPASWNDQIDDYRDFFGPAWYQTRFDLPWGWENQRVFLRFGSINYLAEVWLNGSSRHELRCAAHTHITWWPASSAASHTCRSAYTPRRTGTHWPRGPRAVLSPRSVAPRSRAWVRVKQPPC